MVYVQVGVGVGYDVGCQVYVFLVVGDDYFGVVVVDCLGVQVQGFEVGVVDFVQGYGWYVDWQVGFDCCLVCWVLFGFGGEYLVEDYFVDLVGIEIGLFEQVVDYCGVQFGGGNVGQ